MTTATEQISRPATSGQERVRSRPGRRRAAGGSGRRTHPHARPQTTVAPPALTRAAPPAGRACRLTPAQPTTRLTDRGIAIILLTGAVIVAAALAVITLTAITVTSPAYVPYGQSTFIR